MVRLVWIGDGTERALSEEARDLLSSGAPLFHAAADDPSFASISAHFPVATLGHEGAPDGAVILYPGDGPAPDRPLYQLANVVERLLGPGGCPWDQEQTHESLKQHLLEETYEVLEAIDGGSDGALEEELGDLLLQPMMHAQMKKLAGSFDIDRVANHIVLKLVRRHPHVFGDTAVTGSADVLANWDTIKQGERSEPRAILAGVPRSMPALLRAHEISKRAARSGFEWQDIESVFGKLREEENELRQAISSGDREDIEGEIGDLLFTAVNLARWAEVEPEEALRRMLHRFTERFTAMEAASSKPLRDLTPEEWDELWEAAKAAEV